MRVAWNKLKAEQSRLSQGDLIRIARNVLQIKIWEYNGNRSWVKNNLRESYSPDSLAFKFPVIRYVIRSNPQSPQIVFDHDYLRMRDDIKLFFGPPLIHYLRFGRREGLVLSKASAASTNTFIQINSQTGDNWEAKPSTRIHVSNCQFTGFTNFQESGFTGIAQVQRETHSCLNENTIPARKPEVIIGINNLELSIQINLHDSYYLDLSVIESLTSDYSSLTELEFAIIRYLHLISLYQAVPKLDTGTDDMNIQNWNTLNASHERKFDCNPQYLRRFRKPLNQERSAILVSHENSLTGAPKALLEFKFFLENLGWKVKVIVLQGVPENLNFGEETIIVSPTRSNVMDSTSTFEKSFKKIISDLSKEINPSFILVNTYPASRKVYEYLPDNIFKVQYVHEMPINYPKNSHEIMSYFDLNIFASRKAEKNWSKDNVIQSKVVYPIIDNAKLLHIAINEYSDIRKNLKIPDDHFIFAAIGTIEPRKRLRDVVNAFKLANIKQASLIIVGETQHSKITAEDLRKQHENVHVIPKSSNVADFFRIADCFVMASENEVFPLVLQEAKVFDLPIISSMYPGFEEMFQDGYPAGFFEIGDIRALAGLMKDQVLISNSKPIEKFEHVSQVLGAENLFREIIRYKDRLSVHLKAHEDEK